MEPDRRKRLYNAFDPSGPLPSDDDRNVDVDRVAPKARGYVWADRLADRVTLSNRPAQVYFSGLPGSGKSTELRRLKARLETAQPRPLVALVDALDYIDVQNRIDVPDLVAALVHGAETQVLVAEGRTTADALKDRYLDRLWNWLTHTDLELGQGPYTIPSGPTLVAELRTRPTLRQRLRQTLNAHLNRFLSDMRAELSQLDARARAAGYDGGLIVVFDSLEKLQGTSTTFDEVMNSAERVFAPDAPWFDLPVPVVWTVPPSLVTKTRLSVEFLPMIKLAGRQTGEPVADGRLALRRIVGKRASDADLTALLGRDFETSLDTLFASSGGCVRDLLRTLQSLALLREQASDDDVMRAIATLFDEVTRIIPTEAYPWLARVARSHSVATRDQAEKLVADRLIANNVVLRYQNRSPWFDLHPAIRTIPQVL